jgi:hypothetical protein
MSTEPKKPEPDKSSAKDIEVETIPEGTFAGTRKKPIEVDSGERVPEDTGDQAGGQN